MAKLAPVAKRKFKYLSEESYLAMVKNSVGSKMFRNFYVKDEKGQVQDVLKDGDLSCAVYVCNILKHFELINDLHFTVAKTAEDIEKSGWKIVKPSQIKPGDVLVWTNYKTGKSGLHPHIGFYIGDEQAVSNSSKKRQVAQHHMTYEGKREIATVYRPNWKLKK